MIAIVDRVQRETYGNLVKRGGKICPGCGCQAKANRSTPTFTYYYFECGAPSYKQPRSQTAISQLRQGPTTAPVGCKRKSSSRIPAQVLSALVPCLS